MIPDIAQWLTLFCPMSLPIQRSKDLEKKGAVVPMIVETISKKTIVTKATCGVARTTSNREPTNHKGRGRKIEAKTSTLNDIHNKNRVDKDKTRL